MQIIVAIQALRALAAIGVVVSHFQFDLSRAGGVAAPFPSLQAGNAGVDLFFVVSGFVMVYASEPLFATPGGPTTFMARRLIRIVPLYWLATASYLLIALVVPALGVRHSFESILSSALFVPYPRSNGIVQPVVGQGWTLNFEMLFYAIFASALFCSRGVAVALVASFLVAAVLAGLIFAPSSIALVFWSDPIILEFVFGMALAAVYRQGVTLPPSACIAAIVLGAVLLVLFADQAPNSRLWRPLMWGAPAALIVAGSTLCDFSPSGPWWRAIAAVGDGSYALYLFHSFPVRAVVYVALWLQIDTTSTGFWTLLAIALVGAIAMAIVLHHIFERPVTRALRGLFSRPRSPVAAPPGIATGDRSR